MTQTKRACALICEYNPLHFGHRYQLIELKKAFSTVICILGGNLSQRGEVSVSDRYVRAKAALAAGADLAVELPLPWCCASAHEFASGGVFLAKALQADALAFSAESGADILYAAAAERKHAENAIRTLQKEQNLSYPAAAEQILGKTLSHMPNDILGIEYICACGGFPTYILKREQSFLSSSAIRHTANPLDALPGESRAVFAQDASFPRMTEQAGRFLLATLRNMPQKNVYGVTDELFAHLCAHAQETDSFEAFVQSCTNKMYTAARIRRAAWSIAFGFPKNLCDMTPPYTLLLAANENGRAFLKETAKTRSVPVISRPAELQGDPVFELNNRVNDVLRLFYGGTHDTKKTPFIAE
ncbi:MAG: nucleotidyltransferase family protein [Clostridia bacterium]|nr:nucleotidyltransferase family protein [Clostridia bacterium]